MLTALKYTMPEMALTARIYGHDPLEFMRIRSLTVVTL